MARVGVLANAKVLLALRVQLKPVLVQVAEKAAKLAHPMAVGELANVVALVFAPREQPKPVSASMAVKAARAVLQMAKAGDLVNAPKLGSALRVQLKPVSAPMVAPAASSALKTAPAGMYANAPDLYPIPTVEPIIRANVKPTANARPTKYATKVDAHHPYRTKAAAIVTSPSLPLSPCY
jgi:hypothetical protein